MNPLPQAGEVAAECHCHEQAKTGMGQGRSPLLLPPKAHPFFCTARPHGGILFMAPSVEAS